MSHLHKLQKEDIDEEDHEMIKEAAIDDDWQVKHEEFLMMIIAKQRPPFNVISPSGSIKLKSCILQKRKER